MECIFTFFLGAGHQLSCSPVQGAPCFIFYFIIWNGFYVVTGTQVWQRLPEISQAFPEQDVWMTTCIISNPVNVVEPSCLH